MYYKLEGKIPVPCDMGDWAAVCRANHIARTDLGSDDDVSSEIFVSTVFLGLDHGWGGTPVLFETMCFGGTYDQEQIRSRTYDEALEVHRGLVEKVKAARDRKKV